MKTGEEETNLEQLMSRSLLDVFNERDAERRADAVREAYSPNIEFYEQDGVVPGAVAMTHKVQQLLDGAPPDWTFAPAGEVAVNHDLGRLPWALGPANGTPVVTGTDVALLSEGRIRSLYVFVDPRRRRHPGADARHRALPKPAALPLTATPPTGRARLSPERLPGGADNL